VVVSLGICKLPFDLDWKTIIGAGFLGGIGFTMSIFITLLAFENATVINNAKFMILTASLVAGMLGYFYLKFTLKGEDIEVE
jgi:NhaA family Na+:H+ antiporter